MEIRSPNNIDVLLHCHTRVCPHPKIDAPAVAEALEMFERLGVIKKTSEPGRYKTTPLGKAWVEDLCSVCMPTKETAYYNKHGEKILVAREVSQ